MKNIIMSRSMYMLPTVLLAKLEIANGFCMTLTTHRKSGLQGLNFANTLAKRTTVLEAMCSGSIATMS